MRTRTLNEVVGIQQWQRSRYYNDYIRECKLKDRIARSFLLGCEDDSPQQTMVVHRDGEDGDFSLSAKYLAKLLRHEMTGLLGKHLVIPETFLDTGKLPKQMAQVLAHLLSGDSEKQIAASLAISHHTVNRHVQRVYQHFA